MLNQSYFRLDLLATYSIGDNRVEPIVHSESIQTPSHFSHFVM